MSDDLDDLLASLNQGPVPPLAPADLVRGRGEQRRRRTRLATGVAGFVLVGAVSGTAYALASGAGGHEALQYATPTPSVSATTTATASTDVAPPPGKEVPAYRLIRPVDAGTAAGGHWTTNNAPVNLPSSFLSCATGTGTAATSWVLRSSAGAVVGDMVVDYAATGQEQLATVKRDLSSCEADSSVTVSVVSEPADGQLVVRERTGSQDVFFVLVASGHSLGYVVLQPAELPHASGWAAAALDRMGCLEETCTVGADGCDELCQGLVTPAAGWPKQVGSGRGTYAVYLKVTRDPRTATTLGELTSAYERAKQDGYIAERASLGCDDGAVQALSLDPEQSYSGAAIFFATKADATDFVARYQPGVVGIAHITRTCIP